MSHDKDSKSMAQDCKCSGSWLSFARDNIFDSAGRRRENLEVRGHRHCYSTLRDHYATDQAHGPDLTNVIER